MVPAFSPNLQATQVAFFLPAGRPRQTADKKSAGSQRQDPAVPNVEMVEKTSPASRPLAAQDWFARLMRARAYQPCKQDIACTIKPVMAACETKCFRWRQPCFALNYQGNSRKDNQPLPGWQSSYNHASHE
jgi:hypothetical protein